MARATVPAGSTCGQPTDAQRGVCGGSHTSGQADDGPTFANLIEARQALWRSVCDLDDPMTDLEGDLSALEGLTLMVAESHREQLGPTAQGLHHCARRALDTLRQVREVQDRVGDAALVLRENDPTRLSAEAVRSRLSQGPHVSTYDAAAGEGE